MNINSQDKESILETIGYSLDNRNFELECLIDNSSKPFRPTIKHDNFISIIKRFKGRPDYEASESVRLTIGFPPNSKYSNIRILIKGNGPINNYCNNENLNLIKNSIDFEEKTRVKTKNSSINIDNYGIKFNLKKETNFNNDDYRVSELIRDFDSEMKTYRYKKTFSFQKKTKDFQIDTSIVKNSTFIDNRYISVKEVKDNNLFKLVIKPQEVKEIFSVWWKSIENKPDTKVKVKGVSNSFKNIKDSEVFTNIATYEAEVEYIKNKALVKPKFKSITERKEYIQNDYVNFFKIIGSILQCVQGSLYIMNKDESIEVENKFIKVIENSITETMLSNMGVDSESERKTNYKKEKIGKQGDYGKNKYYQKGGESQVLDSDNEIQYNTDEDNDSRSKVIEGIIQNDNEKNVSEQDILNDGQNDEQSGGSKKYLSSRELEGLKPSQRERDTGFEKSRAQIEPSQRRIARIKNDIVENLRKYGIFFGPMIIDLTKNNSAKIDPGAIPDVKTNTNIHINYLVTDKTDGDRNLLFFDEKGKIYGIDRENNIKTFGASIPALANTILDGEHVTRSEDDKILNNFYIFDVYVYKGENVIIKPFNYSKSGSLDGRHKCIMNAAKLANEDTNIQLNQNLPFRIYKKDYYPSNSPDTYEALSEDDKPLISENCEFLLNKMNIKYGGYLEVGHMFSYKTDGLVFLPNNLAVYQTFEDDYESIKNPFRKGSWMNNYKWKPTDHLTIDFKIEYVKDMATGKLDYKYFDNKKYLKLNLISSVRQSKGPKNISNNKLNFYLLNSGLKIQSIPEDFKFFATNPFIGSYDDEGNIQNNMGEAYFEVDGNDNIVCKDGSFITNGVICECSYNKKNKDETMRWKPERVRADKSAPNSYTTAVTAWELINFPITKDMLSDKKKLSSTGEAKVVEISLEKVAYYNNSNENTIYLTTPFKLFANFVKRYIIDRGLTGYIKPKVLDLAVGKLGDLDKYTRAGVHTLIGIDINEDNINNQKDGASTRIMNMSKNPAIAKLAEKTMLIVGTGTKNISNGECVRDTINKYYIDVLYGRAKGNTPKLRKMEGVGLDKFDMISCMYAIHYMMNNEEELDNFLVNVSENLLDQGYFIGTCLNGDAVLSEMGDKDELKGIIDDKTVFLIKKVYEGNDGNDDNKGHRKESTKNINNPTTNSTTKTKTTTTTKNKKDYYKNISVGNKINVFFETFGGAFNENLVSMNYLKEKAKKHNLKLVDYKSYLEEPGNLLSMYEASTEDWVKNPKGNVQAIRNSNAMTTWAKMNCYFMFQKVRKVD